MTAIAAIEPDPLERARGGDHDAFGQLVAAHQAMVFSIAFHFFGDRDRAADVAQDIFLQLYRNLAATFTVCGQGTRRATAPIPLVRAGASRLPPCRLSPGDPILAIRYPNMDSRNRR